MNVGSMPMRSQRGRRVTGSVVATLKLARPRYLALTIPPFLVGTTASSEHDDRYVVMGVVAIVLLRGVSSIGNCIADRVEDAIDHPTRAVLGERVGWDRLAVLVRWLVVGYLALWLAMVVVVGLQALPAVMWLIFLVLKIAYSFGPRLKPKRHTATLLLGTVSGAMLFVGWQGTDSAGFLDASCAALLLWAFGASLCGSKDVPNVDGDLRAGYRSIYWDIVERHRPLRHALVVVSRPYGLVVAAAVVTAVIGGPGAWLLCCLLLWPLGWRLAVLVVRAQSPEERAFVREYGYLYWLVTMGAILVCFVPTGSTVACALGAIAYFVVAGHVVHPDPLPRRSVRRH